MWHELGIAEYWWGVHVAATWALVGLIWTVQVAVYPQFALVKPEVFPWWHASYTRRIGWLVGPLMGVELVTGLGWVWSQSTSEWAWLGLGLIGANVICTGLVQVPQHRRLGEKLDRELVTALVRGNWVRTGIWTLRGCLVGAVSAGIF